MPKGTGPVPLSRVALNRKLMQQTEPTLRGGYPRIPPLDTQAIFEALDVINDQQQQRKDSRFLVGCLHRQSLRERKCILTAVKR